MDSVDRMYYPLSHGRNNRDTQTSPVNVAGRQNHSEFNERFFILQSAFSLLRVIIVSRGCTATRCDT